MRRIPVVLSVVAVALLGVVVLFAQPITVAQEATPAGEAMMPAGMTADLVTFALGVDLASPADLYVIRLGLDPGMGFPIEASDPTVGVLLVESGTFTVEVDGPVTVTRGAGLADAIAAAESTGDFSAMMESAAAGEPMTLEAGDAAYIPGNAGGEFRNDGEERAVGLGFLVGPPDGMMAEGTPVP